MKNKLNLIEIVVIIAIIGLIASVAIPVFIKIKEDAARKLDIPIGYNESMIKSCGFEKIVEFKGYDIYTFAIGRGYYSVAIPTTNSIYSLEKK